MSKRKPCQNYGYVRFYWRRKTGTAEGPPDGEWSRRINEKDRLVYRVSNDGIIITQCKGHYNDR